MTLLSLSTVLIAFAQSPVQRGESYASPTKLPSAAIDVSLGKDLGGRSIGPTLRNAKAIVLVFTSAQCPIAKRYGPKLRRLEAEYRAKRVRFVSVFVDPTESKDDARTMMRRSVASWPAFFDARHKLCKAVGATFTPEVVVLASNRKMRYRGAIDDLYGSETAARIRPARPYLRQALDNTLAGKPVVNPITLGSGCAISY